MNGNVFSFGIYLAIILGFFFPIAASLGFLIPVLLAIILFFSFLELDIKVKKFFRTELIYYFVFGLLILPFLVFLLTKNFDIQLRLGFFLVAITPTAISAPIIVKIIKGDMELIVSNVFLYNLLSPITYTLLLNLYFKKAVLVPTNIILVKLALMVFLPLLLTFLLKKSTILKKISRISNAAFMLVIFIAVSAASSHIRNIDLLPLLKIIAIVFVFAGISYLAGLLLKKRKKKLKKSLSVAFGHKNSTLTIWIALSNFGPLVVVPMVIYIICHHIINGILVYKFSE